MKCNKCGKTITLLDFDSYSIRDENNQLTIKCSSCKDLNEKTYPIGILGLGSAALLLVIFFTFNYLIFGFITIILAIFAIVFQLLTGKHKESQMLKIK